VGVSYGKGGAATPTGGGYISGPRYTTKMKTRKGIPYLKIMVAIIVLILIGIAWLVLSGYRLG
jgi:hypothetical protein